MRGDAGKAGEPVNAERAPAVIGGGIKVVHESNLRPGDERFYYYFGGLSGKEELK